MFQSIQKETCIAEYTEGHSIWHRLPLLTKFMGDGLLVLWETDNMAEVTKLNLISTLSNICVDYGNDFFHSINKKVCEPPTKLRCGVAMGTVYSVGDGNDFVGPCINLASRLQKLDNFSFSYARRGFNPEVNSDPSYANKWVLKKTSIRGIGNELIYVRAHEFNEADSDIKKKYSNV